MSNKSFVTFNKFEERLSAIHNAIDELDERIDICKEAININSDGSQELQKQLADLTKRMDRYERALRSCQANTASVKDHGTAALIGVVLGVTSLLAIYAIGSKVDQLELDIEKHKREEEKKGAVTAEPQVTFQNRTDGTGKEG